MSALTRLKAQMVMLAIMAAWNFIEPIVTHNQAHSLLMTTSGIAFGCLALNNWTVIRRKVEREKASRWD